ncbi:hypothetical protein EVAR_27077_1 [Eumeta japonica]|uniref:Uncharacterized protein n=1 Tax=Eumeta variegata TaxID=151549 RepID=A0A4C1VJ34_EUMVA|nr:hypothetical protein EVAR_27077_1 [Eumeta japonica]
MATNDITHVSPLDTRRGYDRRHHTCIQSPSTICPVVWTRDITRTTNVALTEGVGKGRRDSRPSLALLRGERACEPPEYRFSSQLVDTRNSFEVASAQLDSWVGIGYLM